MVGVFAGPFQRVSAGKSRNAPRLPRETSDRSTVVAIVVVLRIDVSGVEVQIVRVRTTVDRAGPVVRVVARIVQRRTVDVATASKEQYNKRL